MPIRPELRKFYRREWRTVIRPRILARAHNRCEKCGKPNGLLVWVYRSDSCGQYWTPHLRPVSKQVWFYCGLRTEGNFVLRPEYFHLARRIRVVLTVAHLDHDPANNRDENLKALCQWCHLDHDRAHHKETRATRKDARRPLLSALEDVEPESEAIRLALANVFVFGDGSPST